MKILVVDGDPITKRLLTGLLNQEDFETLQAATVKEALHFLRSETSIQLIISDIVMPDTDGFQLLKFVKGNRQFSQIPFLVCTDVGDSEAVMRAGELGASAYLVKPVSKESLLPKVQKALEETDGSVLIVDDDSTIRDLLARITERDGYLTLTADSGENAMQVMKRNRVFVVISDIAMPGMDGMELLVSLKSGYPDVPVLLITGQAGRYSREEAISAGADGYITKPFKSADILRTLAGLK
ncbi:MAG TPA: response regulator [Acidobacteriota bacterium]|nr:response regulator [Acidobacteriota bacterium]